MCAMGGEDVEFHERAFVEKHLDALACGGEAFRATFVGGLVLRMQRLVAALAVLVDLLLGHCSCHSLGRLDAFDRGCGAAHW